METGELSIRGGHSEANKMHLCGGTWKEIKTAHRPQMSMCTGTHSNSTPGRAMVASPWEPVCVDQPVWTTHKTDWFVIIVTAFLPLPWSCLPTVLGAMGITRRLTPSMGSLLLCGLNWNEGSWHLMRTGYPLLQIPPAPVPQRNRESRASCPRSRSHWCLPGTLQCRVTSVTLCKNSHPLAFNWLTSF